MYIHVIIVAPEKILTPADIPWRREWRHSANSTPLIVESGWNIWVWLVGVVSRRWVCLVGVGEIIDSIVKGLETDLILIHFLRTVRVAL